MPVRACLGRAPIPWPAPDLPGGRHGTGIARAAGGACSSRHVRFQPRCFQKRTGGFRPPAVSSAPMSDARGRSLPYPGADIRSFGFAGRDEREADVGSTSTAACSASTRGQGFESRSLQRWDPGSNILWAGTSVSCVSAPPSRAGGPCAARWQASSPGQGRAPRRCSPAGVPWRGPSPVRFRKAPKPSRYHSSRRQCGLGFGRRCRRRLAMVGPNFSTQRRTVS